MKERIGKLNNGFVLRCARSPHQAHLGALASTNPFRFSSEYAEEETATVYYNYRHYEPAMGRWMSFDPNDPLAIALYAYVCNTPLAGVDLWGLQSVTGYVDINVQQYLIAAGAASRSAPSVFDQTFGWLFNDARRYENHFDSRYHDTVEWYRQYVRFQIRLSVDCKSTKILPKRHDYTVDGGSVWYPFAQNQGGYAIGNDAQQGYWERNFSLGTYTLDIEPVDVAYLTKCVDGKRFYVWKTNMFVVDTTGFRKSDGVRFWLFGWVFRDSRLIMARWVMTGEGQCHCCD